MIMQVAKRRWDLRRWQPKSIGTPRPLGLDHPERKLRKPIFCMGGADRAKVEIERSTRLGGKLLCHLRLSARYSFPVDVTLRFAENVRTHAREVIAFADLGLRSARI